jgi:hemoglobin/transferrin/lactoferrin receptor protein
MLQRVLSQRSVLLGLVFSAACLVAADLPGPRPASAPLATSAAPPELSKVVVTATRTERDPFELPFSTESITAGQLQRALPRNLPESLRSLPSVMLQKTAHGQGSPFIRGFTGFRNLLLIDGVRLNNSVFREGPNQYWNTVDLLSIDRLELVKGPASVLYGSDAIGGTVNALTTRRQAYDEGFDWDRRAYYRVASAESAHTARGEVSGNLDHRLGFLMGGSWKDFGDVRGGDAVGRQPKTGYEERDWDAKLEYFLQPDMRLVLAHQSVNQDGAWRTHSTVHGLTWEGTVAGSDRERILDQNRDLTYLQFHVTALPHVVKEIHAGFSYHLQQEEEFQVRSNDRQRRQGFDVDTLGSFLHFRSPSPFGDWVYGFEYYLDWVDSFSTRFRADGSFEAADRQGPIGDDSSYDLAGVFVQNTLPLGERVEFTLGGRYNYVSAQSSKVTDPVTGGLLTLRERWDSWVGSGRVLVRLDEADHWHVFGGVSQGFRAPNLSDLTRFDIARSGELEIPALDLEPEEFVSLEGGVKLRYEPITLQAGYFYTDIDQMIIRTPTGRTVLVQGVPALEVTKRNSGEGYVHGAELSGQYRWHPQWTARAAFTWMDGKVDVLPADSSAPVKRTEPLSRLMPTTFDLALLWEHPGRKYWAEASWTIADKQDRLASADTRDTQRIPPGGTPGFSIYNLRAGWRPVPSLSVTAAIENLSDEDYRIHGSGLNEPGRNFVLGLDYRF